MEIFQLYTCGKLILERQYLSVSACYHGLEFLDTLESINMTFAECIVRVDIEASGLGGRVNGDDRGISRSRAKISIHDINPLARLGVLLSKLEIVDNVFK